MEKGPWDTYRNPEGGHDSYAPELIARDCVQLGISSTEVLYRVDDMNGPTRSAVADYINAQNDSQST